jgi:hypothetical protein
VPALADLQASLGAPIVDDDTLRTRLDGNYAFLEHLARTWQAVAAERHPGLARFVPAADAGEVGLDVSLLRPSRSDSAFDGAQHDSRVVAAKA